jgi:hypothetical protein
MNSNGGPYKRRQRFGVQRVRRSWKKRALSDWEIQRKIERFRLFKIDLTLDGIPGPDRWHLWPDVSVQSLELLLRAGIRPGRGGPGPLFQAATAALDGMSSPLIFEHASRLTSEDWLSNLLREAMQHEYAQKFYGVKP